MTIWTDARTPKPAARRLYARLLAVVPTFPELRLDAELHARDDQLLILRILGVAGAFRRVDIMRLQEVDDEELEVTPSIQLICLVDAQAACVVQFFDSYLHPTSFSSQSDDVHQSPNRVATALVASFFDDLIQQECRIEQAARRHPA
jgi:hypothetical protein